MKKKDIIFGFIYFHRARDRGGINYVGPIKYRKVTGLDEGYVDFIEMSSTCDPTGVSGTVKILSFSRWADGAADGNMIRQLEELRSRIAGAEERARAILATALESINGLGFTVGYYVEEGSGGSCDLELSDFEFEVIPSTQEITVSPTTRRMKMVAR